VGPWPPDQFSAFVEHLEHCSICRRRLVRRLQDEPISGKSLDLAIAHALEIAPWVATQRDTASTHIAELLELPASDRAAAISSEPKFQTYSLATHLLKRSEKSVSQNLGAALAMARLARAITVQIDPRTCGGMEALADLGAYSLATEGNVHRVGGRWRTALSAFARAREVQKRGCVDPDLMARIDLMESSLRRDLGQLREALYLLHRVEEISIDLEDSESYLCSQINRANIELVREEPDAATTILEQILCTTDDPHAVLLIRHNLAWALAQAGQTREAAKLLEESRDLYSRFSDPLITSRRLWLEGLIAKGLGQGRRAETLLQVARSALEEHGYAFDAALVRHDLGRIMAHLDGEPQLPR